MTNPQDPDFFEVLSGKQKGHPVAENLRESLLAQAETIKQAENAPPEKLPDYEQARIDAIKKQLFESGVFEQGRPSEPTWLSKFFDLFKFDFVSQNWGAGFAVAASVMVVSFIVFQQPTTDTPTNIIQEMETTRGGPSTELVQTENESTKADDIQREQRKRYASQQYQQRKNAYQQGQLPNAGYSKPRSYINERIEKKIDPIEPDDSITDENTQIASETDSQPSEPDISIAEPETQIASEQESAPKVEQYAKAEQQQSAGIASGKLSELFLGISGSKSPKQHGLAFVDKNPEGKVSALQENLTQVGADVVVAQINDDTWIVEVSVPYGTKLEAIKKQMAKEGFSPQVIAKNPPYEIRVQREK